MLKLAAGATTQRVVPFSGLSGLGGVAVNSAGDVYVADRGNHRVLNWRPGHRPGVLPFTELAEPAGVAVDTVGNVYVTDFRNRRVLKLAAR